MAITTRYDLEDQFVWDSITSETDETGTLLNREVVYDDGRNATSVYDNGVRTSREISDFSAENIYAWQSITVNYNVDGSIADKSVIYDDGRVIVTEFDESGKLIRKFDESGDGASHAWDSQLIRYDLDGNLVQKVVEYDDGRVVVTDTFESGKSVRMFDESGDGTAYAWANQTIEYDLDGNLVQKVVEFDDGRVVATEIVEDGKSVRMFDGSGDGAGFAWDTQTIQYDTDGNLVGKVVEYDDGRVSQTSFSPFGYKEVRVTDESGDGVAYAWDSVASVYDENGDLVFKTVLYDDGRFSETQVEEDGTKVVLISDEDDAYNWEFKENSYDADGELETQFVAYDNFDTMIRLYDGGDVTHRLNLDGNDSSPWYAREYVYDNDGNIVETNFYDNPEELPDYYQFNVIGGPDIDGPINVG